MRQLTWLLRWLVVPGAAAAMFTLITLCVLDGSCDWVVSFWSWLTQDESGSTTIRNVGLVIGAVVAWVLTVRRIKVADRQAETAQQSLLYDRYQKSAEMLGGRLPAVRLGGIYALQQLATEHPEPFLPLVVSQYCAFVRHPFESNDGETGGRRPAPEGDSKTLREDVRAAMEAIVDLGRDPKTRKEIMGLSLDLSGANLSGVILYEADLSGVNLSGANLHVADLSGANLPKANLSVANLSGALLYFANLSGANLYFANLSGAILSGANLHFANLSHANLSDANLHVADLSDANLSDANLPKANLSKANLSEADLSRANLSGADLYEADLSDANLSRANLSGADILGASHPLTDQGPVRRLTQDQLNKACADPGDPPDLRDALNPDGSPLSWRGSPCGGSGA